MEIQINGLNITLCENVCSGQTYADVNLEVFRLWELQDLERKCKWVW
jgi:hypothetical protein